MADADSNGKPVEAICSRPPAENDTPAELPMSAQAANLRAAVNNLSGRPRHACRSAYAHLELARAIMDADPGMALFRAITAEEEAASALIHAVRERGYDQAGRLDPRRHVHKAAVFPFVVAVAPLAGVGADELGVKVRLDVKKPRFDVRFSIGSDHTVQLDNPLNFFIARESDDSFVREEILENLAGIAKNERFDTILGFIRQSANDRNRILYADDEGYPVVQPNRPFIIEKLRRVNIIAGLTIAVAQTSERQAFVEACVRVFADVVTKARVTLEETAAPVAAV